MRGKEVLWTGNARLEDRTRPRARVALPVMPSVFAPLRLRGLLSLGICWMWIGRVRELGIMLLISRVVTGLRLGLLLILLLQLASYQLVRVCRGVGRGGGWRVMPRHAEFSVKKKTSSPSMDPIRCQTTTGEARATPASVTSAKM